MTELVCLLIASTASMAVSGAELPKDYFNGLQLAFVRMPAKPADEEQLVQPKPKAVPAAKPAPATQPAPAVKPAPVFKPAPSSVIKPAPVVKPAVKDVVKPAPATKPARPSASSRKQAVEWIAGIGWELGGDTLGDLNFVDGSSTAVKANAGLMLYAGVILPNGTSTDFSTQITVGYKYGGARGSGGGAIWTAIPLEAIEFYRVNDLRMGLGISYHLNPQLSVSAPGTSYVDKYGNALGLVAQIGWSPVREHYGVDLRYTSIKFQGDNVVGPASASGSVVGLYASYRF